MKVYKDIHEFLSIHSKEYIRYSFSTHKKRLEEANFHISNSGKILCGSGLFIGHINQTIKIALKELVQINGIIYQFDFEFSDGILANEISETFLATGCVKLTPI